MMYIPPDLFQQHDHVVLSVHTPDVIYPHNFVHGNITSIIPRHTRYHLVACMGNNAISVWLQSPVGGPVPLKTASLRHMKTQLRELRYFSGVTKFFCQFREWGWHVHQMGDEILPQLVYELFLVCNADTFTQVWKLICSDGFLFRLSSQKGKGQNESNCIDSVVNMHFSNLYQNLA